jgi:hypothetical protein
MQLMKSGYWRRSKISTLLLIKRPFTILRIRIYGNYIWELLFSIIMEQADNGDLFQKISEHQKARTFFSESEIWKMLI